MAEKRRAVDVARTIPLAFGVVLVIAALGLGAYAYAVSTPQIVLVIAPPDVGPSSAAKLSTAADVLAAKLAQYTAQAETLRSMATLLIGLGALYTIALGVGHYLSVEAIQKKAEKSADELAQLRDELAERYPMLEGLADSLETMVERLAHLLAVTEDADIVTSYSRLSLEDRAELLLLEQNLSIYAHPNVSRHVPGLGMALRGYGRFYLSRLDPNTSPADDVGGLSGRAALIRAKYYLERTIALEPENVTAVNDLSVVFIQLEDFEAGRRWCSRSLKIEPSQQRVLFNRARIERKAGQLGKAVESLTAALKQTNWERKPSARRRCDLFFNLACYRATQLQNTPNPAPEALHQIFEDLDNSVHAEVVTWYRADTRNTDGDLYWLAQAHQDRFRALDERFDEAAEQARTLLP